MRVNFVCVVAASLILATNNAVSASISQTKFSATTSIFKTSGMNKRFLRSYDMDDLDKEGDEERMINPFRNAKPITPQKLDDLLVKEKIEFDEKNIETLFNQAKDGKIDGWLDDAALKILDPTQKQNIALMRENFNRLKGMGVTIQKVEKLKANKRYTALIYRYQNMLNLYISHLQAVARNAS